MPFTSSIDTTAWAVLRICMNLVYTRTRGADNGGKPDFLGIAVGQGVGRRTPRRRCREVQELGLEVVTPQCLARKLGQSLDDVGGQLCRTSERRPRVDVEARQRLGDRRHVGNDGRTLGRGDGERTYLARA